MSGAWNPSRWLGAPRGSFKPAPGLSIAPHLQLVRPVTGAPGLNVWVADQLTLQIEVAVKFAPPDAGARPSEPPPEEVHRFLRQARCAARIGDPHLLQILEQGRVKGVPFIVTQLREGRSLNQRLHSGPLSLREVLAVVEQASGVLAKAHPLGLFHGSLCPEHLFLTETAGQPFLEIANFGDVTSDTWANDPASQLAPDAPSRKQAYLSPEQIVHGIGSSAASDIWALGVLAYELLTTTLPFEATSSAALSVAICNTQFAPPSRFRADVPPALDIWFARVFAKELGARLLNPRELASEFGRALGSAQTEAGDIDASELIEEGDPRELDNDFETEERTVRWDLPSDWAPPSTGAPSGSQHPPTERSPAPFPSSSPPRVPVLPRLPASGPPPLPDRPPSSRPPPVGGYAALSLPPPPRVSSALLMEAALTEVARGTLAPQAKASAFAHFFKMNKARGVVAGTLLGAGAAFLAWGFQSWPDNSDAVSESETAAETRAPSSGGESTVEGRLRSSAVGGSATSSGAGHAAARAGARPSAPADELPVILQTDDLPQAPEESAEDEETSGVAEGTPRAGSVSARGVAKPDPKAAARAELKMEAKPSTSHATSAGAAHAGNARSEPAPRATVAKPAAASATPRRETAPHNAKHASADCNPPYFFDNNNIRRLKLECL